MKNAILYYYGLHTDNIYQVNKKYTFTLKNQKYVLLPIKNEKLDSLNKISLTMRESGVKIHEFIVNKDGYLSTIINNISYVLLRVYIGGDEIVTFDDLISFPNITINYQKQYELVNLWKEKIDYIEYQMSQFGKKHKLIEQSINYYIGLAETAILLIQYTNQDIPISIMHRRIKLSTTLFDFYNPLNLVLDSRVRDFTEYFKFKFFNDYDISDEINKYFNLSNLSGQEYIIFLARMIFPTYYFDLYEEIIISDLDENVLNKILSKTDKYQKLLSRIYNHINNYIDIPDIEWLKKDVILN